MRSLTLPRSHRHFSLAGILQAILSRGELRRARNRLAQLDDHLLSDIGLTREEALKEAAQKDWNAPDHWYR
jgi:uncharacterized protein YjiS (DUF1127 family)